MSVWARAWALSVGAAVALLSLASCRDATQVLVEARTNLAYRDGLVVSFTVGKPGETEGTETTTESRAPWGADGFVGSLAVVPGSGDDAALSVRVVLGVDREARACTPPDYRGCIVTRRRLRYTPHERLRLPVTLYAQCKDVPCDAQSTCNLLGQCVTSEVITSTCDSDEGCALAGDPQPKVPAPMDASLTDSPAAPPDGAISDASADADARADAGADGGNDGGDAGTIAKADCRTITCDVTNGASCCYNSNNGLGACLTNQMACPFGGGAYSVTCDGNEDCKANEVCCAGQNTFMTCATSCAPIYPVVCHSTHICTTGTCTGLYAGYYAVCQ